MDVECVQDLVCDGSVDAAVSNYRKHARSNVTLRTCFSLLPKLGSAQGSRNNRSRNMDTQKELQEMLHCSKKMLHFSEDMLSRSKVIRLKIERLRAQSEILLEHISQDMDAIDL